MKKCPVCNSSKFEKVNGNLACARCGYINKSTKNINEDLNNNSEIKG